MSLANRSLVSVDDLSNGEIEALFSLADIMASSIGGQSGLCRGKIMASLFFEPSTRTRLSFEAAMHRLGGSVMSAVDIGATSLAKGESIADMARVVGSYADIIVIRHPWEGAARVVADYAGVPVINAGDGGHEHPTPPLCDLYTPETERGAISGLRLVLWGDLKYGRTVHSLACALARFGATILFHPAPGLGMPERVLKKLTSEYRGELVKHGALSKVAKEGFFPLDAVYITPSGPHQLAMMPDLNVQVELEAGVDALYVTRLQKERSEATAKGEESEKDYRVVNKKLLKEKGFRQTLVMHPLPRVDELAYEIDADPRSMYFKQAAYGVPVRMALIAMLLGSRELTIPEEGVSFARRRKYPVYKRDSGISCPNPSCVSNQKTEARYIKPEFSITNIEPLTLNCVYCESEICPQYIASSDWHEGKLDTKKYHSTASHLIKKIKPENLIIFDSEGEAHARGFKPSSYVTGLH